MRKLLVYFALICMSIALMLIVSCESALQEKNTDAADVAAAKSSLAIGYAVGDSSAGVTQNLTLASTAGEDVDVAWSTSISAVVSADGVVTRPLVGQSNAIVTLRASLSKGVSTDSSDFTITVLAAATPSTPVTPSASFMVSHSWTALGTVLSLNVLAVASSGATLYAGTMNDGLCYSDDNGSSWDVKTLASGGLANDQIYAVTVSSTFVYIGTFDGLSIWDRNVGAESISNYLDEKSVFDIKIDSGKIYLAASDGIYWDTVASLDGFEKVTTSFDYPEHLFIAGGKLYATGSSSIANPEEINVFDLSNLSASPTKIDAIPGISSAVGPLYVSGTVILLGADFQLYRSINAGVSFTVDSTTGGGTINGFAYDGSRLCLAKYGNDLWYSSDLSATWNNSAIPGYSSWLGISASAISSDGTELMIGHSSGLVIGHF